MSEVGAVRGDPPPRRRGGRTVDPRLILAMSQVLAGSGEWYRVKTCSTRGGASSAANRMRRRDWNALLGASGEWEVRSGSTEDGVHGVWARHSNPSAAGARAPGSGPP